MPMYIFSEKSMLIGFQITLKKQLLVLFYPFILPFTALSPHPQHHLILSIPSLNFNSLYLNSIFFSLNSILWWPLIAWPLFVFQVKHTYFKSQRVHSQKRENIWCLSFWDWVSQWLISVPSTYLWVPFILQLWNIALYDCSNYSYSFISWRNRHQFYVRFLQVDSSFKWWWIFFSIERILLSWGPIY